MTTLKTCFKCNVEKPLTDFYPHPQMGDGHLNKCKACTKKDVAEHRAANIERVRDYDRAAVGSRIGWRSVTPLLADGLSKTRSGAKRSRRCGARFLPDRLKSGRAWNVGPKLRRITPITATRSPWFGSARSTTAPLTSTISSSKARPLK
jgi:hypothetical protein